MPTLHINFFLHILSGQKREVTELKLLWPFNMTVHGPKISLIPGVFKCIQRSAYDPSGPSGRSLSQFL